ncbi:MAG: hypothetical protein WD512_16280, partial [Candidatus Paceibacterota bacterium]
MITCNGCLTNQPNQLSHMDNGGCLNSKDQNFLLSKLNDYMFTGNIINKFSSNTTDSEPENKQNNKQNIKRENKQNIKQENKQNNKRENTNDTHHTQHINQKEPQPFSPYEKDKLFWCFYIFLYGFEEYEMSKSSSFVIEKNFKIKTVEQLPTIKDKLKELKLKITDIQDDLINQQIITIKGLHVLCLIHDISIIVVKDKTLYEIIVNDKPTKVIINENNKIFIPDEINEEKITYYRNNYWKIDNISKPLNGFSSYSLTDLQEICKKLDIEITTNGKKIQNKDLYQSILSKIN